MVNTLLEAGQVIGAVVTGILAPQIATVAISKKEPHHETFASDPCAVLAVNVPCAIGNEYGSAIPATTERRAQNHDRLHYADGEEIPSGWMPVPFAESHQDHLGRSEGKWLYAMQGLQSATVVLARDPKIEVPKAIHNAHLNRVR